MMRVVGRAATLEILLEGRIWGAREAYEKGLVNRVVPDDKVVEEAYATARRIAEGAPLAARWHKKFVRRLADPRKLSRRNSSRASPASTPRTSAKAWRRSWLSENPISKANEELMSRHPARIRVLRRAGPDFPNRPVRIMVGSAAGGGTDIVSRLLAAKLQEVWGQPVVVENRTGASASIAADFVAKSPPDGYTVVMAVPNSHTIAPHLIKLPYDPLRDFTPITLAVQVPHVLVVAKARR